MTIAALACLFAGLVLLARSPLAVTDALAVADARPQPHSYNEVREYAGSTVTATFFSHFINYLDGHGQWQPIDLTATQDRDGFHITHAPYELHLPLRSSGDMRFVSTNRYDVASHDVFTDAPITKKRTFTTAADVAGEPTEDGILYRGAFGDADLLIKPSEEKAQYLIVFNRPPESCSTQPTIDIPMHMTFDGGLVPRDAKGQPVRSATTLDTFTVASTKRRAISTPKPRIWDSSLMTKEQTITFSAEWDAPTFTLTKHIPCSFFDEATYPVYSDDTDTFFPDPSPESTSVDGRVAVADNVTWDAAHDATDGTDANDSASTLFVEAQNAGISNSIYRTFILFDTSSIPDTVTVTGATVSMWATAVTNQDNDAQAYTTIVGATPASTTAITTADYDQAGATDNPTKLSDDLANSSLTTGAYNVYTLNTAGRSAISKTSVTKLAIREGHDQEDAAIAASSTNLITFSSADQTGTTQDPKLTVAWKPGPDLSMLKTGPATVASGSTISYTLTAQNLGPDADTGVVLTDIIPTGFAFNAVQSSTGCSQVASTVQCDAFTLVAGTSTGRIIAFDVRLGTGGVVTNTATITGALLDVNLQNNSGSAVTTVTLLAPATAVRKSTDETVTSSTSLQEDDELKVALTANKTYIIEGTLFATSTSATPDIKTAFEVPTGSTMDIGYTSLSNGTQAAGLLEASLTASENIPIQGNQITVINIHGTIVVGGSSGNAVLYWAQNNSNGNATRVKAGSYLEITEIP